MKCLCLLLLIISVPLVAEVPAPIGKSTTGKAKTKGECSPAVSGNHNYFVIKCGVDSAQGKRMLDVLNKILANQIDTSAVMSKLDEIIASRANLTQTCVGSNCAGINYGTQNLNFGTPHPPPRMTFVQESLEAARTKGEANDLGRSVGHPVAKVTITLQDVFYNPAFAVLCDVPCTYKGEAVFGASSAQGMASKENPNAAGAFFAMPSQMAAGTQVMLLFESRDERKVTVLSARPYIPPVP